MLFAISCYIWVLRWIVVAAVVPLGALFSLETNAHASIASASPSAAHLATQIHEIFGQPTGWMTPSIALLIALWSWPGACPGVRRQRRSKLPRPVSGPPVALLATGCLPPEADEFTPFIPAAATDATPAHPATPTGYSYEKGFDPKALLQHLVFLVEAQEGRRLRRPNVQAATPTYAPCMADMPLLMLAPPPGNATAQQVARPSRADAPGQAAHRSHTRRRSFRLRRRRRAMDDRHILNGVEILRGDPAHPPAWDSEGRLSYA